MQSVHAPQSSSSGGVGSTSTSVTSVPSTTQEPWRARDQHRVLAVEADSGPRRSLAVDVLVRVDEHAVGAAQPPAERLELLA